MNPELIYVNKKKQFIAHITIATVVALILKIVLDFVYVFYIDRFFSYSFGAGLFNFTGIKAGRMLESYAVTFLLSICLAVTVNRRWQPSEIVLVLYFIVVVLPLTSLYGLSSGASSAFFYAVAGSFVVLLTTIGLLPKIKVPRPGRALMAIGLLLFIGMSAYVYGMLLYSGGIGRLSFNLLSVYDVRAEYVQNRGPFIGYFVPWQANVVNIALLCYALHKKNRFLLVLCVAAQLLLFGMTGHKSFLLSPFLAVGVYITWKKKKALLYIIGGSVTLIVVTYVLFLISGNHLAPSIMIRRLFFVPAGNHFIYYDFFSKPENPFVMLSNSFLSPFFSYPYKMPVTRVISWAYWGRDFGPNVGYLGDAFAHFGFVGMFVFSAILGVFLRIVDSVGSQLPANLVAAVIATPAMSLTNSALFTSLLTHGMILAVILLWLLKKVLMRDMRNNEMQKLCMLVPLEGLGLRKFDK